MNVPHDLVDHGPLAYGEPEPSRDNEHTGQFPLRPQMQRAPVSISIPSQARPCKDA